MADTQPALSFETSTEPRKSRLGWLLTEISLVGRLLVVRLRGQLQYRASFLSQILGNGLLGLTAFSTILVFFTHLDQLGGWTVGEIAILFGIAAISFGLGRFVASGLAGFPETIVNGRFDQLLTRPVSPFSQVLGSDVQIRWLGTALQGGVVLSVGIWLADLDSTLIRLLALPVIVMQTTALYVALFALEATVSFWTTRGVEAVNIATVGGNTLAPYPFDIFSTWLKGFFLFVVPLAFAVHIPMAWVLGKPAPLGLPGWIGLLSAPVLLVFCLAVGWLWGVGVRRYRSTGS